MDYEKMIALDQYALDKEWAQQSGYMFSVMKQLAQAKKELDEAKDALSLRMAQLDMLIRDEAVASGMKLTEKMIESQVMRDADVQEKQKRIAEAKYNINILEAARAGLENKRDALSNLVKLHGMAYFAEPEADIEARGELEELKQEEAAKKIKARMRINRPMPVPDDLKQQDAPEPEKPKAETPKAPVMKRNRTPRKEQ